MKIAINGEILEVSGGGGLPEGTVAVKPLTQAEYDALTDEEKQADVVYAITDDGGSGDSSSEEIYSTEETRIGTWIDGKPLYRRVFRFTHPESVAVTDSGPYTYNYFRSSELLSVTRISGLCWIGGPTAATSTLPYRNLSYSSSAVDAPTRYINFLIKPTSDNTKTSFSLQGMANSVTNTTALFSNSVFEVILEYTKTTDTGGTT